MIYLKLESTERGISFQKTSLSCIEIGDSSYSPCTYRTEIAHLVNLHSAFLCRTIATFLLIASALEYSHHLSGGIKSLNGFRILEINSPIIRYFRILRRRNRLILRHHILPFALEIHERGEIRLPRLRIGRIIDIS